MHSLSAGQQRGAPAPGSCCDDGVRDRTLGGTALTLAHVNPVQLLVISAYLNGIAAAPFLVLVMLVSSNPAIMGEHAYCRLATTLGWASTAVMAAAAITSFAVA